MRELLYTSEQLTSSENFQFLQQARRAKNLSCFKRYGAKAKWKAFEVRSAAGDVSNTEMLALLGAFGSLWGAALAALTEGHKLVSTAWTFKA